MSEGWLTIVALTAATVVIRASGPLALGGRELPEWGLRVISLLAPSLLAALVVIETLAHDDDLTLDARAAGLAAAAAVLAVRTSLVAAVLAAAATAALVRAVA
jgi:branched-subunit amino acid transport protein